MVKLPRWPQEWGDPAASSQISTSSDSPPGSDSELDALREVLKGEEGYRRDVYLDSRGIPTVGIGHKVLPADNLKVGDYVDDSRIQQLFAGDGLKALNAAKSQAAEAGISDPDFVTRLGSVNFQLGTGWTDPFKQTWTKVTAGDYSGAAENLGRSLWAQQTPARVKAFQDALLALPPKKSRDP